MKQVDSDVCANSDRTITPIDFIGSFNVTHRGISFVVIKCQVFKRFRSIRAQVGPREKLIGLTFGVGKYVNCAILNP